MTELQENECLVEEAKNTDEPQKVGKIMIPFTPKVIGICAGAGAIGFLATLFLHHNWWLCAQNCLLYIVLAYAAMVDLKMKLVSNWTHLILIGVACIRLVSMLLAQQYMEMIPFGLGFILLPLPLFAAAGLSKKNCGVGGGDIKLMAALGLNLGIFNGFYALVGGLILSVIVVGIRIAAKKTDRSVSYALVLYLAIGAAVAALL